MISHPPIEQLSAHWLSAEWFGQPATVVAPALLGCWFCRRVDNQLLIGQIVETEAYEAGDLAMYAYQKPTPRNQVVFGPAGMTYIYRIYRQYHCFNIVTDVDGKASTILIRAVHLTPKTAKRAITLLPNAQLTKALAAMRDGSMTDKQIVELAAGPGKFCRMLQLDESLKGLSVEPTSDLWISPGEFVASNAITQTTRIGLSKGADIPWRWYITDSPAVSKRAAPANSKH